MMPPPLPPRARTVPGWVWLTLVLGLLLTLSVAAGLRLLVWAGDKADVMADAQPKKGVDVTVAPGEERVPAPGVVTFRNLRTGAVRAVRLEGEQTELPAWLAMPKFSVRTTAWSRRGNGRHEAFFGYYAPLKWDEFHARYEALLRAEEWTLRPLRLPALSVLNGVHRQADRELFLTARPLTENTTEVSIRLTEPDKR